jgi:hypothetical protein
MYLNWYWLPYERGWVNKCSPLSYVVQIDCFLWRVSCWLMDGQLNNETYCRHYLIRNRRCSLSLSPSFSCALSLSLSGILISFCRWVLVYCFMSESSEILSKYGKDNIRLSAYSMHLLNFALILPFHQPREWCRHASSVVTSCFSLAEDTIWISICTYNGGIFSYDFEDVLSSNWRQVSNFKMNNMRSLFLSHCIDRTSWWLLKTCN